MTKPVWSHVLALSAWTLKIALKEVQTIPDCMASFAITLNHRRTFLLHINMLACVKAEI